MLKQTLLRLGELFSAAGKAEGHSIHSAGLTCKQHTLLWYFMHLQPCGTWVTRLCQRNWVSHRPYFSALPWSAPSQPLTHSHFTPDKCLYQTNKCIQGTETQKCCCCTLFTLGGFQLLYHTCNLSFCTTGQTSVLTVPAGNAAVWASLSYFLCSLFMFALALTSCHEIFITSFAFVQFYTRLIERSPRGESMEW